eukprot:4102291-Pyramimonas_sp.AAC.1
MDACDPKLTGGGPGERAERGAKGGGEGAGGGAVAGQLAAGGASEAGGYTTKSSVFKCLSRLVIMKKLLAEKGAALEKETKA